MIACSLATTHRLTSAAFVAAVALALVACKQEANLSENPPTVVRVETVALTDYATTVRLTGDIRALVESDLSFRVSGRIVERTVDVGDHVTADQVLARLDPQHGDPYSVRGEVRLRAAPHATPPYQRQKPCLPRLHDHAVTEPSREPTADQSFARCAQAPWTARDRAYLTAFVRAVPACHGLMRTDSRPVSRAFSRSPRRPAGRGVHSQSIFTQNLCDPFD